VLVGRGATVVLILFLCWSNSNDVTAFGSSFSLLSSWIVVLSTVIQEEEVLLPISDRTGAACEKPWIMLTIGLLLLSYCEQSHSSTRSCSGQR
jgi:hypothetical protein